MSEILFINGCVRGERSRSLKLARAFLSEYEKSHPADRVTERNLMEERLEPLYPEVFTALESLSAEKRFDQPLFEAARQFQAADKILIAAPFWELSFPALVKIYLERVSVVGLTFGYDQDGRTVGYCKAKKLLLVTTRGGDFSQPETAGMEFGASQLKALCGMYGIPEFECLCAEGLDDVRNDPEALMAAALDRAAALAVDF